MSIKKQMKGIERDIKKIEKGIKGEIKYTEKWMHERRKFLIKLAWVLGFITVLLVVSNVYMKIRGFG